MKFIGNIKGKLRWFSLIPISAYEVAKLNSKPNIQIPIELIWHWTGNMHHSQFAQEENLKLYSLVVTECGTDFFDISPKLRIRLPRIANAKEVAVNDIREIIIQKIYEFGEVNIKKGDVVIDVGANIGIFSMMVYNRLHELGNGHLVCIEPIPDIASILKDNIDNVIKKNDNKSIPVSIVIKAVLDYPKTIKMALQEDCFTTHRVAKKRDREKVINIEASNIDTIVDQLALPKVDFIKMDIEGAEIKALLGAQETLKKWQPKLAISAYHTHVDYWKIPKTIFQINPKYKILVLHPSGSMCYAW